MISFVIYSQGYNPLSGGSIALNKLAHNLELCGEKAYLWSYSKNPDWLGELIHRSKSLDGIENPVVIYPEVVKGNPREAQKVVRWLLSIPGFIGGDGEYGSNDLVMSYSEYYAMKCMKSSQLLTAYDWRFTDWGDDHQERKGVCYCVRKGSGVKNIRHDGNIATPIDGYHSNRQLREYFNHHGTFISYDHMTMLSVFAVLCGCESMVVPEKDLSADEWRRMFPYFRYGIAYGEDDLRYAFRTKQFLPDLLLELEKTSMLQTEMFIKTVRGKFK